MEVAFDGKLTRLVGYPPRRSVCHRCLQRDAFILWSGTAKPRERYSRPWTDHLRHCASVGQLTYGFRMNQVYEFSFAIFVGIVGSGVIHQIWRLYAFGKLAFALMYASDTRFNQTR